VSFVNKVNSFILWNFRLFFKNRLIVETQHVHFRSTTSCVCSKFAVSEKPFINGALRSHQHHW